MLAKRFAPLDRLLVAGSLASILATTGCSDGDNPFGAPAQTTFSLYDRPAEYSATVQEGGQQITLRDGVKLSATVTFPADGSGARPPGPFPVILTQTGYNKSIPAIPASNAFLVEHGYAHVSVDVRGTGTSGGEWEAFSETEQEDYREVMDWVASQPWSDGRVGTWGASFMGITQLFTAAWQHPAHKAVFAIVPMADSYRDIVFNGGQTNAGFIPLWMGLVTALGVIPTEPGPDAPAVITEHIASALLNFQVPQIVDAFLGSGNNYDGEFWRIRSPIEKADRIRTPTFIVGGLNDIFQRGEPMLYEALKGHTSAKLLIGPWQHIESGDGLPRDGVPDLDHLALAWLDHWVRGIDTGAEAMPAVTQYLWGAERYATAPDWPHPEAGAERWYLRGDRSLSRESPAANETSNLTLQQPLNGICSTSTSQWTAGLLGAVPLPCFTDNRLNEILEITYSTAPFDQDYYVNGPIEADVWVSTTAQDTGLLVRITDVAPDGSSKELTNGILTASLRKVDESRSRFLDGQRIQPWHPFTADSLEPVGAGEIVELAVEVFPTSVVFQAGHRLRVTVGASDFPHGLPPLPDLVDQAIGVLTVMSDAEHPSSIVVPAVPVTAIPPLPSS